MEVTASNYLKARMKMYGYDVRRLAELSGMSSTNLCSKINNPKMFRIYELERLQKLLKIPDEVIPQIVKGNIIES